MIIREKAIKEKYFDIQLISFVCGMVTSYILRDLSGNYGYFALKTGLSIIGFGVSMYMVDRYMK